MGDVVPPRTPELYDLARLVGRFRAHDPDGARHAAAVARIALRIGAGLGLERPRLAALALGAVLHDVGKLVVPVETLAGRHALDAEQWAVLRSHAAAGEALVAPLVRHPDVRAAVRWHHERVDGHGYPDGLAGDAIPLAARIVAVADAYEAMVTARPYAPARPPEGALAEAFACAGRQFDRRCVDALAAVAAPVRVAA